MSEKTKKTMSGKIISDKMTNTAVVEVTLWKVNRIIKKRYKVARKFMAENPGNEYKAGELVLLEETRPLSRHKNWKIAKRISAKEMAE